MPPACPLSAFSVHIFQSRPSSVAMSAASGCMAVAMSSPNGPSKGKSICRMYMKSLFRKGALGCRRALAGRQTVCTRAVYGHKGLFPVIVGSSNSGEVGGHHAGYLDQDRKSTRLNSSHVRISYAVFCLKKKKKRG